jgi:hypothetical protein
MTSAPLRRQAFVMGVSSFGAGLGPLDRAVDHARGFGELLRGELGIPDGRDDRRERHMDGGPEPRVLAHMLVIRLSEQR